MVASRTSNDVVGDIYDAVVDPEGWPRLPEIMANAVGATSANVTIVHEGRVVDGATYGLPGEALARYSVYYHYVNPMIPAAIERGLIQQVSRMSDIMPTLEFQQTEFYVDFARVFDTVRGLACGRTQLAPTAGAMGYGLPAAVAAALLQPHRLVVNFSGDTVPLPITGGSLGFNVFTDATCGSATAPATGW